MRLFLLLAFCVICTNLQGQSNFQKGSVTLKDGTKISGEIDFRDWRQAPSSIAFRKSVSVVKYSPKDLKSFEVSGVRYVAANVQVEISPSKLSEFDFNEAFQFDEQLVFLQVLFEGEKSLYFLQTKGKNQFYIKDSEIKLLPHKKHFVNVDDKKSIQENRIFVQQLKDYLTDCPFLESALRGMEYTVDDFENLFTKYEGCSTPYSYRYQKVKKSKISWGLYGGLTFSKMKFKSEIYDYLVETDFPISTNLSYGISAEMTLPGNLERNMVLLEFGASSHGASAEHKKPLLDGNFTNNSMMMKFHYLDFVAMYRRAINRITLGVGIGGSFLFSQENTRVTQEVILSIPATRMGKAVDERNLEQALLASIGFNMTSRLGIDLRYRISNGMAAPLALNSVIHRIGLLARFSF